MQIWAQGAAWEGLHFEFAIGFLGHQFSKLFHTLHLRVAFVAGRWELDGTRFKVSSVGQACGCKSSGQGYLDGARLPRLVQPFIQRLAMSSGETVSVSVLDGHEIVYVARSNSPRVVSIGFYAGARVPAHVVGPGAAILSTLNDADLKSWIANHEFSIFNSNAALTPKKFEKMVLNARKNNYCISAGNLDQGLTGVAVPLRDRHGECKAALSMTLQSSIWSESLIVEKLLPLIIEASQVLRAVI